jgi:hypothetical protein
MLFMVDELSTEWRQMSKHTLIRVCEGQLVAAGVALRAFFREHQEVQVRFTEGAMHDEVIALIDRKTSNRLLKRTWLWRRELGRWMRGTDEQSGKLFPT